MRFMRFSFALGIVLALTLGLAGSALAHHKPDHAQGPPAHAQGHGNAGPAKARALQGAITSVGDNKFSLDTKRFEDPVNVVVNGTTKYSMPGGKKLVAIFAGIDRLAVDDQVIVRGSWSGDDFNAAEVRLTGKNLKRFTGVTSNVNDDFTVTRGDDDLQTFTQNAATVVLNGPLANGQKVQVIHRKDSDVALGVIVRKD